MEAEAFLKERAEKGLLRRLKAASSRGRGMISFEGKDYIDLSSNDYLGLSDHPKLIAAGIEALGRYGAGSSASRLLSGGLELHHRLEEEVAHFKSKEAALVFNSGYQANIGILSSICAKDDAVFCDKLSHASILDGIALSGAKLFRFRHNDPDHLTELLKKERPRYKDALIVTETIFSMDGDRAPLRGLVDLRDRHGCRILVDEAHATGIYGKLGSGVVEEDGLTERIDFIMGTFSKALGSFGAYLAASRTIVEYLVNTSRSFIYSTALPPAVIACNLASLDIIRQEPDRREKLIEGSVIFRDGLKALGLKTKSVSQIVPVTVGESSKAMEIAGRLQKKGYWVLPIRPPTVPQGESRLRFSLGFYHDEGILKKLLADISDAGI